MTDVTGHGHCCRTCFYWVPKGRWSQGFPGDDKTNHGQCRRHPPQAILTDKGLSARWPVTLPVHWCGEHAVADEPADR